MAGAPPVPTNLKILRGNPGKRPLPKSEPKPKTPKSLQAPARLSARGREIWDEITKVLMECRVLTDADVSALEVLCATQEKWEFATAEIARLGFATEMRNDRGDLIGIKMSPFVSMANMAQKELIKLYIQFGMTPAARTRISVGKEDKKSEWDEF